MKIKLERIVQDYGNVVEWCEGGDIEVEVPDAIIADWRETIARLAELSSYFDERVKPQIDAEYKQRREEWGKAHPEEVRQAERTSMLWSKALLEQALKDASVAKWLTKFKS